MTMTPITSSSNVKAYAYDGAAKTLSIEFATGTYEYAGVEQATVAGLEQVIADGGSVGSYISRNVVRQHDATKLDAGHE